MNLGGKLGVNLGGKTRNLVTWALAVCSRFSNADFHALIFVKK